MRSGTRSDIRVSSPLMPSTIDRYIPENQGIGRRERERGVGPYDEVHPMPRPPHLLLLLMIPSSDPRFPPPRTQHHLRHPLLMFVEATSGKRAGMCVSVFHGLRVSPSPTHGMAYTGLTSGRDGGPGNACSRESSARSDCLALRHRHMLCNIPLSASIGPSIGLREMTYSGHRVQWRKS